MATLRLGAFTSGLTGKSGTTVFVQTPGGVLVRDRVIPHDPQTPSQVKARMRLRRATMAWSNLDPEAIERWESYAQELAERDPATGFMRSPRPMNVFCALYMKLLMLDPTTPPPHHPPAQPFFGDRASLVAHGEPGAVRFEAVTPNGPGTVTELLLQPLASRNRATYPRKYRTQGFHVFAEAGESDLVSAPPGWTATGYRFVDAATGRTTPIVGAGKVLVG
jgi:hypothetical protein